TATNGRKHNKPTSSNREKYGKPMARNTANRRQVQPREVQQMQHSDDLTMRSVGNGKNHSKPMRSVGQESQKTGEKRRNQRQESQQTDNKFKHEKHGKNNSTAA
ncbi:5876_t:CDS:2, partial [Ambispora leptoticha]